MNRAIIFCLLLLLIGCASGTTAPSSSASNNSAAGGALEIADLQVNESMDNRYPLLDVKVVNAGKKAAILSKVEFRVSEVQKLNVEVACEAGAFEASASYDVDFPLNPTPYTIERDISQSVGINGADRFHFYLKSNDENEYLELQPVYAIVLKMAIIYNGHAEAVSEDVVFVNVSTMSRCGFVNTPKSLGELNEADKQYFTNINQRVANKSIIVSNFVRMIQNNCVMGVPMIWCGDRGHDWEERSW